MDGCDLVKASKVRIQQENRLETNNDEALQTIMGKILSTAESTEDFYIYHYDIISTVNIGKLRAYGYEIIDLSSQREGTCYKISW